MNGAPKHRSLKSVARPPSNGELHILLRTATKLCTFVTGDIWIKVRSTSQLNICQISSVTKVYRSKVVTDFVLKGFGLRPLMHGAAAGNVSVN